MSSERKRTIQHSQIQHSQIQHNIIILNAFRAFSHIHSRTHARTHAHINRHYFLTYKLAPDQANPVAIPQVYGREEALRVIGATQRDYSKKYGNMKEKFQESFLETIYEIARETNALAFADAAAAAATAAEKK